MNTLLLEARGATAAGTMFDFIRKRDFWRAMDLGLQHEVPGKLGFQLKTIQDLCVYEHLRDMNGLSIAEVGGGGSRVLPALARKNRCFNIEPFQGDNNGPTSEIRIPGVQNIRSMVGTFDPEIVDRAFDAIFSISVAEHVPDADFQDFIEDCIRILKPGGVMYHAIDIYVGDPPTPHHSRRFEMYRRSLSERSDIHPIGPVFAGKLAFTPDIASNPDNVMYSWKSIAPSLDALRQQAQCVSLLIGARRL